MHDASWICWTLISNYCRKGKW